jgi:transcriptional regulator with XRE-family HTH domain
MFRNDRFRSLRLQNHYTHEKLAELLGVGKRQIARYEAGQNDPTGDIIVRMAKVFGVSADYLLGNTELPQPTFDDSSLSQKELEAIAAWRKGERLKAIEIIADDRLPA